MHLADAEAKRLNLRGAALSLSYEVEPRKVIVG